MPKDRFDEAEWVARNAARNEATLNPAMEELARCCSEVIVHSPPGGADLGAILIAYQLKGILEKYGLCLVPQNPSPAIKHAWKVGWFRSFQDRYQAAMREAWKGEASR